MSDYDALRLVCIVALNSSIWTFNNWSFSPSSGFVVKIFSESSIPYHQDVLVLSIKVLHLP